MYIAGRLRTASSPSRTLMLSAPYSLLTCVDPLFSSSDNLPSHSHRHDDVGVVVTIRTHGPHHCLADFILQLERHDFRLDDAEEIEDVLRVEADRERRPAVFNRDGLVRFAELGAARGHFDLALLEDHLDRARSLVRENRDAAHGLRQAIALELDALVVAFRNDLLVGGKLPVDHSRDEEPGTNLEEEMILASLVL